jgi:hypothetical protein
MDDSPTYDNTDRESDSELDSLYDALKQHDDIRFATYRTAAKLRYIQRKAFLHHIDIWNMIEAFRENGLNTLEPTTLVNRARMETLLSSLYSNLNKRLPPGQNIDIEKTSSLLSTWLLFTYCSDETGRLRVFSIKMALAVLSCGKLMDKLRYMFSQLTDCNGQLIPRSSRFSQFLKDILKLPAAVGERHTFNLKDEGDLIFEEGTKVTVNEFLETMMSDPGPQCVSWLLVLHRITAAESVFHPVPCSGCRSEGFPGLRYKSDSANYHLCQMCFWRGNMDEGHRDDVFKEYSVWKTPGKPSGLRRSMRCVPAAQQKRLPRFPDKPEQTLDLANIVPASPLPAHNGFHSEPGSRHMSPAISGSERLTMTRTVTASPHLSRRTNQFATLPQPRLSSQQDKSSQRSRNEEHDLIARYANHLAGQTSRGEYGNRTLESSPEDEMNLGVRGVQRRDKSRERGQEPSAERKDDKNSRRLVHELELKNAEIMREIARLRQNRATVQDLEKEQNPGVTNELESLRLRKVELEFRLNELQETRKDLMSELEELMKVLKVQGSTSNQAAKFSKISRNANLSTKLRPYQGHPIAGSDGLSYERSPGDTNNSESRSSPDSVAASVPASVTSLSE